MRHNKTLTRYFDDLQHAGTLEAGADTFIAEHGNENQGDIIKLYIKLESGVISTARFQCYGNPASLAACEFVCRWLIGKKPHQLASLSSGIILDGLNLSEIHNHVAWRLLDCLRKLKFPED